MPVPRALIERLPNLKLICITGYYHRTLDVADTVDNLVAFANGKPIRILTPERNDSRLVR